MAQLPLSFVAEAKVLPYVASPRTSAASAPVASLSDAELLERLLDPPSKNRPTPSAIAEHLLAGHPRGLVALLDLEPAHLAPLGLSADAASRLVAALEIGRRLAWAEVPEEQPLTDPAAVARHLFLRYASAHQEVMGAVLLNLRNQWLGDFVIARGTIDRISVEPRQALVEALRRGATGIILFHNHPSGDPSPSGDDYEFTRRFTEAAAILDLKLIDHLVLGSPNRWYSIRDRRPW